MRGIYSRLKILEDARPRITPGKMLDAQQLNPRVLAVWQAVDFDIRRLPTDELELLDEELRRHM